jgi:anti-sigma factor RsiW
MNCEEAWPSLDAFVDGELELPRQLAMETHLAGCPPCREAANRIANCSLLVRKNRPFSGKKTGPASNGSLLTAAKSPPSLPWSFSVAPWPGAGSLFLRAK